MSFSLDQARGYLALAGKFRAQAATWATIGGHLVLPADRLAASTLAETCLDLAALLPLHARIEALAIGGTPEQELRFFDSRQRCLDQVELQRELLPLVALPELAGDRAQLAALHLPLEVTLDAFFDRPEYVSRCA